MILNGYIKSVGMLLFGIRNKCDIVALNVQYVFLFGIRNKCDIVALNVQYVLLLYRDGI